MKRGISVICLFSQFKRFAVGALVHGGMHLVGTHGDAVQGAVILIRAVVVALVYGTLDAMVGTTGFHIESLLSFDRFYDGVMASC